VELQRKIAPHAESGEAVQALLDALEQKKQLSNARYAEARTHQLARKYGAARIRQDLKSKGVNEELVGRVSEADDLERARAILERKYRTAATTREERAKRMRFLQSRGFSSDVIRRSMSAREDSGR
jgi:regulatory protein